MKENNIEDVFSVDSENETDNIVSSEAPADMYTDYLLESIIAVEDEVVDPVIEPAIEVAIEPTVEPTKQPTVESKIDKSEKIALYSNSNLFKFKLGELKVGYNIVSKEDADIWLKSKRVRVATPEEVAKYYSTN